MLRNQIACIDTCPCHEEQTFVFVQQHAGGSSKLEPLTLDFNGNVNDDIIFEYEENTDLNGACSLVQRNEIWVVGGVNDPRQVRI